ncbi:TPM domain-containing protein [Psychrobacillus sp.]|uniref:TPM domain-containing protein n=1 Tax=Psychrobacillus sp. TaxID=1871623 RepID=UPI0028BEEA2E|nr:TPM domain-containing protein [Psychrobacillus sp.]
MKKVARMLIAALLLFLSVPLITVAASDIPKPQGGELYVQDFVGVLSNSEEEEIEQLGQNLDNATGAQIVVMIIESLNGQDVAQFGVDVIRQYGIGNKEKNNGALLIIETDPTKKGKRDVHISVGQGLEGALPDGKLGRIVEEYTLLFLEQGSINDAVLSTYQVLYNEIAKEYGWDGELVEPKDPAEDEGFSFMTIIAIIVIIYLIYTITSNGGRGGGSGGSRRSSKPSWYGTGSFGGGFGSSGGRCSKGGFGGFGGGSSGGGGAGRKW